MEVDLAQRNSPSSAQKVERMKQLSKELIYKLSLASYGDGNAVHSGMSFSTRSAVSHMYL